MSVDFDNLVNKVAQNTFSVPCVVTPYGSIPLNPVPYKARGIYSLTQIDMMLEDGTKFFSVTIKFAMRIAELPATPMAKDQIQVTISGNLLNFVVDHVGGSGQGDTNVFLKSMQPEILPIPVVQQLMASQ